MTKNLFNHDDIRFFFNKDKIKIKDKCFFLNIQLFLLSMHLPLFGHTKKRKKEKVSCNSPFKDDHFLFLIFMTNPFVTQPVHVRLHAHVITLTTEAHLHFFVVFPEASIFSFDSPPGTGHSFVPFEHFIPIPAPFLIYSLHVRVTFFSWTFPHNLESPRHEQSFPFPLLDKDNHFLSLSYTWAILSFPSPRQGQSFPFPLLL